MRSRIDFLWASVEAVEPEEVERTDQAAVAIASVIGVMAKLDQSVDRAGRLAPVLAKMTTKFGGKSVADD